MSGAFKAALGWLFAYFAASITAGLTALIAFMTSGLLLYGTRSKFDERTFSFFLTGTLEPFLIATLVILVVTFPLALFWSAIPEAMRVKPNLARYSLFGMGSACLLTVVLGSVTSFPFMLTFGLPISLPAGLAGGATLYVLRKR